MSAASHIIRVTKGAGTVVYRSRAESSRFIAVIVHHHDAELDDDDQAIITVEDERGGPWPYCQRLEDHLTADQAWHLAQLLAAASVDARATGPLFEDNPGAAR